MTAAGGDTRLAATFLDAPHGRLFVLRREPPDGAAPGAQVLIVPPFAEEMNRSRRLLSELARELAANGLAVCLPDLTGTGDSEGDFATANWATWLADVAFLRRHCLARYAAPLYLLGLRTGALLAAESVATQPERVDGLICVQAVATGDRFLTQLLRTRVAAAMSRGEKETTKGLRARLDADEPLTIAGYTLAPALARELAARRLDDLPPPATLPVLWYEVAAPSTEELPSPSPPTNWPRDPMVIRQVRATPVWNLQEAEVPRDLIGTITADCRHGMQ